jgi:Protein of unknown function (DUF3754)
MTSEQVSRSQAASGDEIQKPPTKVPPGREHFVPVRVPDLVDFLADGKGAKVDPSPLPETEAAAFRKLADRLVEHFHRTFRIRYQHIKDTYAPFDPDRDTVRVTEPSAADRDRVIHQLFDELRELLGKANYVELSRAEAERVMQGHTLWGLELDVDWTVFDHLLLFYRGDSSGPRTIRRWWKLWIKEEKIVPEFSRLVVILKQRPHRRLGKSADTSSVFLKIFKDMPKPDLEMVLPGTRIRLTKWDKGLIVYPVMSGLAVVLYKLLSSWIGFRDVLAIGGAVSLSWSLAALFAGYGYRSYSSYTGKKTAYNLQLTQSLYYQVIGTNAGVFFRLLDEAEEQEVREAVLGYYYLWRHAAERSMTADELDDLVQKDLDRRLGVKVDFEIEDAVEKLKNLKLVRREERGFRAVSIEQAVAVFPDQVP